MVLARSQKSKFIIENENTGKMMGGVIKFINKWYWLTIATFSLTAIFLFWDSYHFLFETLQDKDNNKKDFFSRYSDITPVNSMYDSQYITHRLIKMDSFYGITTGEIMNSALRNVNKYLQSVNATCPYQNSDQGAADYLTCANKVLHDNFYYAPSVEVSNNYAVHRSDCDTNTYLMMDAMRMKGMDSYIVYSPRHAFLAWKDRFGNFNYRETTSDNNKGKVADLSTSFYTKTVDRSYYFPMSVRQAENTYNSIIYKKSEGRVDIDVLYNDNKSNAIISDWYFYAKDKQNKISESDAQLILSLLYTDFTSTDKKMAVINYFMQHKQSEKASVMLAKIPTEKCARDCFMAGVDLGKLSFIIFKKPFLLYDDYLKSYGVSGDVQSFRNGFFLSGLALMFVILTGIMFVWKFRKKKCV